MNTRIIALTCALIAAACSRAHGRSAQDPAPGSAGAAPSSADVAPATGSFAATRDTKAETTTTTTAKEVTEASKVPPNDKTSTVANEAGPADHTKGADNTKLNERDRHGTLTPLDQGNSVAETNITAAIRKGIMGDETLSFTGKNVKVITVGSKVTLRGPVQSDQAKAAIEALATQTAGVSAVDNQLEVKN